MLRLPAGANALFDQTASLRSNAGLRILARWIVVAFVTLVLLVRFLDTPQPDLDSTLAVGEADGAIEEPKPIEPSPAQLHLLIPATSSNLDLCKLMLSGTILDYPTPMLINYGDVEQADPYVQHLAKVEGILQYLEKLLVSGGQDEDLVLVVDGYDAWFQLRPDVLLKRYFASNEAAWQRTVDTYGEDIANQNDMRQSIIFGPDKICWPIDFSRPACWAVPEATLGPLSFGPETSAHREEFNMPRWLNSGTILGPVRDLRDMFSATLDAIHTNHTTDSDQFYFANVFGAQEYARLQQKPEFLEQMKAVRYGDEKDLLPNATVVREAPIPAPNNDRTEYHIGIDYRSGLFQTLAYWKQYLTWTRASSSWQQQQQQQRFPNNAPLRRTLSSDPFSFDLPEDIATSRPPFDTLPIEEQSNISQNSSVNINGLANNNGLEWSDVDLCYNSITHEIPVIIHFTGEKRLRETWWTKLWFHSHAENLLIASMLAAAPADPDAMVVAMHHVLDAGEVVEVENEDEVHSKEKELVRDPGLISDWPIGGKMWYHALPPGSEQLALRGVGGAWSDTGGWFPWDSLCKAFEPGLYDIASASP